MLSFPPSPQVRVFVARHPVDMRKSIDGLSAAVIDLEGGLGEQLAGCPFGEMRLAQTYKVDERANWKIALDAQNELYHLPFQHSQLIGFAFALNDKKHTRFQDVNLYNHHSVWSCEFEPGYKMSPLEAKLSQLDPGTPEFRLPQLIGEFDFFVVFPNTVILLFQSATTANYITYNFWPLAVDRTIWEIRSYFQPATSAAQRLNQEYFKCMIRDVLQEDSIAHESLHAGLASRAKTQLHFQDEEAPIRYFHEVVERYVGAHDGP